MKEARQAAEYAAAALGFSDLGVARADIPQGDTLRRWLKRGCHAGMDWLERHLPARLNPQLVLPGARSVIILTYEYPRRDARQQPGVIARYAQGEDYHKLLSAKLADLDETLSFYGGRQVCFSDSGPISERFFASSPLSNYRLILPYRIAAESATAARSPVPPGLCMTGVVMHATAYRTGPLRHERKEKNLLRM